MAGPGERTRRRREFVRDDLAAYWPTYVAGACFLIAFLYAVFVRQSAELGAVAGVLAMGCVLWPRSAGLRARLLGGNELAAPKGSTLTAPELEAPEISAPPLREGEPAEQPDDPSR